MKFLCMIIKSESGVQGVRLEVLGPVFFRRKSLRIVAIHHQI